MTGNFWTEDDVSLDGIDVDYIINISNEIPASGDLNSAVAAVLAVKFLRAADICSELISRVSRVVGYRKTEARKEGSRAAMERSAESSMKGKEMDRDRDQLFVDAKNQLVDAETLLTFLTNKHSILMAAHYMCRDIVKGDRVGDFRVGNMSKDDEEEDTLGEGFTPEF